MFYCDDCAKKKKYPIIASEKMKSFGPCEICGKERPCNDIRQKMLDLGFVELFYIKKDAFLNPEKKSFYAPAEMYRIIGFNLKKSRELDTEVIVAVNYKKDFTDIDDAKDMINELRSGSENDADQQYFLFNSDGYMQRIE